MHGDHIRGIIHQAAVKGLALLHFLLCTRERIQHGIERTGQCAYFVAGFDLSLCREVPSPIFLARVVRREMGEINTCASITGDPARQEQNQERCKKAVRQAHAVERTPQPVLRVQ